MKFVARLLLPFVAVWLCVMPSRSYALLPLPVALVLYGGSASAGGTAVGSGAAGWGLLLGLGFAFIGLSDSNGDQVRLPLTSDPADAVPAPEAAPTAPSETGYIWTVEKWPYAPGNTTSTSSALDACTQMAANDKAGRLALSISWWWVITGVSVAPDKCLGYSSDSPNSGYPLSGYLVASGPTTCPAGYSNVGGVCQLTDARVVTPDNNCDYSRSGSALAQLSDPDCGGGAQLPDCNVDGSVCIQTGTDPVTGRPRTIEIRTNPDGGSTIIQRDESLVGNVTVTDSTTVTIGPSGTVDSVAGNTTSGPLPTSGEPTGAPVQPVTVNFPSDYARTGEAQTAANTLAPKLDTIHSDLSVTQTVADPLTLGASDMPDWGATFGALNSWTVPAHSSACPAPSVDLSGVFGVGSVYAFDAHCQLVADHYNALQAAMMVVWSLLALFVVLRA